MIRNFKHKGLERFFRRGDHRGIPPQCEQRVQRMLDMLDVAIKPDEMNVPGCRFHGLKGKRLGTYAVAVTGNLRITFAFDGEDAIRVDLEDYH